MVITEHRSCVNRVTVTSDGNKLISCGEDGNVFVWSLSLALE